MKKDDQIKKIKEKPNMTKSSQLVIAYNTRTLLLRMLVHRYDLHK